MPALFKHFNGVSPGIRLPWAALAVAGYVFLAPNVDFNIALAWHDGQRLAQLGLFLILLLTLALPGTAAGVPVLWTGLPLAVRLALSAAFVLGLASSLAAPQPRWALLEWGQFLLLLGAGLAVAADRRALDARADRALVLLFFALATAYAVTACGVYGAMLLVAPAYGQGFDLSELYTGFSNVRFFGHVQTMLLPFLLLPALWWGSTRARRLLLWSVPVLWWMLAVGSGTRGTWVALLAGVVVVLVCAGSPGRQWAGLQVRACLCGIACYALFVLGLPQWFEVPATFLHRAGDILSLSLREVLWTQALDFIRLHPLLGVGPMHTAYWNNAVASHPHNILLQWGAEWGLPAALLLTGVWATGGIALARRVFQAAGQGRGPEQQFRIALLAALTGASAQAMVDGVFVMPVSQTLLALLAGWALGMAHPVAAVTQAGRSVRAGLAVAVVLAATAVGHGVAPEIGRLAERQKAFLAHSAPDTRLLPRYWAQGWIHE